MSFSKNKVQLNQLFNVAMPISNFIEGGDVIILKGEIGAGKTTLVAQIASQLGIDEDITSPTFAIVQTYIIAEPISTLQKLIHVDTYRLAHLNELYDLGFETLFDENAVTFIEWGEKIEDHVDANHFMIEIDETSSESRDFVFTIRGEIDTVRQLKIQEELLSKGWKPNV